MKNIHRSVICAALMAGFMVVPQAEAQSSRYGYDGYDYNYGNYGPTYEPDYRYGNYGQQYAVVRSLTPISSNTTMHTVCSDNPNRYIPGGYPPDYRGGYTNSYGQYVPYPYGDPRDGRYDQYGRYDRYDGYYQRSTGDALRDAALGAVISGVVSGGHSVGTVVGTVVNDAVRNQVYNQTYGYPRNYPTQRYCWTERRPAGVISGYDVQYQYNGRLLSSQLNWAPRVGQAVQVDRYGSIVR